MAALARMRSAAAVAAMGGQFSCERLDQFSNRLDAEMRGKVMDAVHVRVPMVTPDEQRA